VAYICVERVANISKVSQEIDVFAKYIALDPIDGELRTINQVWDALDRLDGDRCSILIVAEGPPTRESEVPFSGRAIAIAGGAQNQFLCEAYDANGDYHPIKVRNPEVPISFAEFALLRRGQLEEFHRHWIVGRAIVERALKAFVERGEFDKDLIWEA
jgi:hypothetical protein